MKDHVLSLLHRIPHGRMTVQLTSYRSRFRYIYRIRMSCT